MLYRGPGRPQLYLAAYYLWYFQVGIGFVGGRKEATLVFIKYHWGEREIDCMEHQSRRLVVITGETLTPPRSLEILYLPLAWPEFYGRE